MVTDALGLLLEDVAKLIGIAKLEPDRNNSCLIKFPNAPSIQLELDKSGNYLMIGCDLGEIPPGPYRENVFKEALKYNGKPPPRSADFAFSKQANKLVMTKHLLAKNLRGEAVVEALTPFQALAKSWQEALSRGDVPSSVEGLYQPGGSKMFGMK
jgi:hypothetical protein